MQVRCLLLVSLPRTWSGAGWTVHDIGDPATAVRGNSNSRDPDLRVSMSTDNV